LAISGSIDSLFVLTDAVATNKRFRFYGIDIEHQKNSGIVYHSLGVGAAAFRSVLQLEKLVDHSNVLLPDMVLLDFGTNDILYTNAIDKKLPATVEKAIAQFRAINPNIFIVLTSTQDLYKNGKYITAGVEFVHLMDSLAQKNDCFFWNWYDLAGGYGTINTWKQEKYAKSDGIHLTADGYAVKGEWLFRSFQNSLQFGQSYPVASCLIPMKGFPVKAVTDTLQIPIEQPVQRPLAVERYRYYTVRAGDTLGKIAQKYGVSISALKRANGLRSDILQIGKRLKIPK
jgi:LysM repeat protein